MVSEGQIRTKITVDGYALWISLRLFEVRRTLADEGTLWLNIGDDYTSGGQDLAGC